MGHGWPLYSTGMMIVLKTVKRKTLKSRTLNGTSMYPEESILSTIIAIVLALVFPASGVGLGATAIARRAAFVSEPLEQAARAGALYMVVRTKDCNFWTANE